MRLSLFDFKITTILIIGAAFLMATSAIGPGFLTQTAVFTERFREDFAFIILISVLIDIGIQLNIWRIICISGKRAQELADNLFKGLGLFMTVLIFLGGLIFNIGNFAGCGLGINALLGIDVKIGVTISLLIAIALFISREYGQRIDFFATILGTTMIALTIYVILKSPPSLTEVAKGTIFPSHVSFLALVTLVGGTVGGYISFSGAHRLLDAGVKGIENIKRISKASVTGILITGLMRSILFLAVLGVVSKGNVLDPQNPPASAFFHGAGIIGYRIFGFVLWSAAITSVVGCSYTSVSFLRGVLVKKDHPLFILIFVLVSALSFLALGRPVSLLILAGALNGLIPPLSLGIMLVITRKRETFPGYSHPKWILIYGILSLIFLVFACWKAIESIGIIFK
ncbi:MAG: NRAMP family divalent metal transporter [Candidatus Aminicenantia bacterium]